MGGAPDTEPLELGFEQGRARPRERLRGAFLGNEASAAAVGTLEVQRGKNVCEGQTSGRAQWEDEVQLASVIPRRGLC